jgi:hypothetical protein
MLRKLRGRWRDLPMAQKLDTPGKVAQAWVLAIQAMEKHRQKVYSIRYEDLVREPRRTLNALAHWLDVDPAGFRDSLVRDTSVGKYRTGLTASELAEVNEIAGPTLARLNYL